jgi:hypothetical protein
MSRMDTVSRVACLCLAMTWPFSFSRSLAQAARPRPSSDSASPTGTFKIIGRGESRDEDGNQFALTAYRSPDGRKLTAINRGFDSERLSEQYLEKQTAKASRVIKVEPKTDRTGRVVGKRAEIMFSPGAREIPAVLWTQGSQFHEIVSDSLPSILSLEKQLSP